MLLVCLLIWILLSYSDVQSIILQLHDEQITHQKSNEGNLKVKNPRAKNRKSPYQLQASVQQHQQLTHYLQPLQSSPKWSEISPSWQAPSAHKWYPQTKSPLVHTPTQQTANHSNLFITSRSSAQSMHEQSPGGSNSSCQGITPRVSIPLMTVHMWAAERTFIGSRAVIVCLVHLTRLLQQHSNHQKTGIKRQRMGHTINS